MKCRKVLATLLCALAFLLGPPVLAAEEGAAPPLLRLEEATARALANNHTLKAAGYTAEAAGHRVELAGTAYNPSLDLSSDVSHSGTASSADGISLVTNRDNLGLSVGGRLTLFDATRGPNLESAKQSEAAAQSDWSRARRT
jgi:outer membrane protein TolC